MSAHSAGAYTATLLVMVNIMRGGGRADPDPHQTGPILSSSLNVRQKAAVATLCTRGWNSPPPPKLRKFQAAAVHAVVTSKGEI